MRLRSLEQLDARSSLPRSNIPEQRLVSVGMRTDGCYTMSFLLTNDMIDVPQSVLVLTNGDPACTFLRSCLWSLSEMEAGNDERPGNLLYLF